MNTKSLACILLAFLPIMSRGFVAIPLIQFKQHHASLSSLWAHDETNDCPSQSNQANIPIDPNDVKRRNLLKQSSSLLAGLVVGGSFRQAAALEADNKIVLQTSTENDPVKFVDASAITTTTPVRTRADTICIDSEERRIAVFERTAPSVVFIDTFTEQRDVFSTNVMEVPLGSGSGFVWDDKGHIVTNYHVVRNARSAQVAILTKVVPGAAGKSLTLASDETTNPLTRMRPTSISGVTDYKRSVYKAKVVGVDPGKDICVLKVDAPDFDLFPIEVGTSTGLRVGQGVMAIGNPYGLDHTLTVGVISGIGRQVKSPTGRPITNVIQSDAAINPGNSGGPLLDSNGKLIGMNTAIYSPSGGSAGVSFAIPVDTVKFIVDTLIRDGRVIRPILGITYLNSKQARVLGITKGVLVLEAPADTPAAKAGLRGTRRTETGLVEIGDVITKIEGTPIDTEADLFEALENFKPGDTIKVTVSRVEAMENELRSKEVVLNVQLQSSTSGPGQVIFPYRAVPQPPQ